MERHREASQVGFAELKETDDDRANIGGIIGTQIVGQQLAQCILTDHQDVDCRPMIGFIIVAPIVSLFTSGRCSGYYCFANHWYACIGPMFNKRLIKVIYRPLIPDIRALVGPAFIDRSLLPQY